MHDTSTTEKRVREDLNPQSLDASVDPSWFNAKRVIQNHQGAMDELHKVMHLDRGPLATQWTIDLQAWYFKLQKYFGFNPSDLAGNVVKSQDRWKRRLRYLKSSNNAIYSSIMADITEGHKIPLAENPKSSSDTKTRRPSLPTSTAHVRPL